MASKYEAYWRERLPEIRELVQTALGEGESDQLPLPGLTALGQRGNWRGTVRVRRSQVSGADGAAHVKALGHVLAGELSDDVWLEARVDATPALRIALVGAVSLSGRAASPAPKIDRSAPAPATAAIAGSGLSRRLHDLVHRLPRRRSSDGVQGLPEDGIYFFFERGEDTPLGPRIVRVGINEVSGRFRRRLRDHFEGRVRGSVFRRHVGAALSRTGTVYGAEDDEQAISDYMFREFTFAYLEVRDDTLRRDLEEWLVWHLARERAFAPSAGWLGRHSPNETIRATGLWNVEYARSGSPRPACDLLKQFEELVDATHGMRWPKTLIVIPCSGAKARHPQTSIYPEDRGTTAISATAEAAEGIRQGRSGLAECFDLRSPKVAALDRYDGRMYAVAGFRQAMAQAMASDRTGVLILSGGYGFVRPDEFIHMYDKRMNANYWKRHGIGSAIAEFVRHEQVQEVVAFAAPTSDYRKCLMAVPWRVLSEEGRLQRAGIMEFDFPGGHGAQSFVPELLGQAVVRFWESKLDQAQVLGAKWPVPIRYERLL